MNILIDTVTTVHPASFPMNFLAWLVFVIPGLVVALFGCVAFLVDDKAGDKFKLLGFTSLFLAFLVAILSFVTLAPLTLTALAYAGIENLGIVILLVALSYVTNFAVGYGLVLAFTNRFAPNARERL
jgi:hypothetical protein